VACALATLAKGPAGLALPALTIAIYLVLAGRAREIVLGLELPRGLLLFAVVAAPWYHCMHVRHGAPFWRELIGDNYLNRATGRSGDRGTFEYYLPWIAYGTFPWCGVVALGVLRALADPRRALAAFALTWATVDVVTVTLVTTKFHHYVVPALPALAILGGLVLDRFLDGKLTRAELGLVALPLVILVGRDLAALPARLVHLFSYEYIVTRPWPSPAVYGHRYEFGRVVAGFAAIAAALTLAMILCARARAKLRTLALVAAAGLALAWSLFLVDDFLIALSPHWSQKQPIAAYYRLRRGPDEPIIAWNLYWRGENFYTRNQISSASDPRERTEWAYIDVNARLREYLPAHRGRRLFFLVEPGALAGLRAQLPADVAATLRVVDDSNNKLYLAVAEL
jgi:4-amino-4-deoxy-L-arabinose transferase-like glycosyltransferase